MAYNDILEFADPNSNRGWIDIERAVQIEDLLKTIDKIVKQMNMTSPCTSIMINVHCPQNWLPEIDINSNLDEYDALIEAISVTKINDAAPKCTSIQFRFFHYTEYFIGHFMTTARNDNTLYGMLYWYKVGATEAKRQSISLNRQEIANIR